VSRTALAVAAVLLPASLALSGAVGAARGDKAPDLVVKPRSDLPAKASPGDRLDLAVRVENIGDRKASKSKVSFRLSADKQRSRNDLRLGRKKKVEPLKPGEDSRVTAEPRAPADADGSLYVIACVKVVDGEKRKAKENNCKFFKTPISFGADPFPKRLVGTTAATHTMESSQTGNGTDVPPGEASFTETLTATVIFERVVADGQDQYKATGGEVHWKFSGTSSGSHNDCTRYGQGKVPISLSRDGGAFATLSYEGSLAPGALYALSAGYGLEAPEQHYTTDCVNSDPHQSDYSPSHWLPHADDRDHCPPSFRQFRVKSDGSLAATDSCEEEESGELLSGSYITNRYESSWQWELKPEAPEDEG